MSKATMNEEWGVNGSVIYQLNKRMEQLQAENERWQKRHIEAARCVAQLEAENERLKKERDAAVIDFTEYVHKSNERCKYCLHDNDCEPNDSLCYGNICKWEWRGAQGEEA